MSTKAAFHLWKNKLFIRIWNFSFLHLIVEHSITERSPNIQLTGRNNSYIIFYLVKYGKNEMFLNYKLFWYMSVLLVKWVVIGVQCLTFETVRLEFNSLKKTPPPPQEITLFGPLNKVISVFSIWCKKCKQITGFHI